MHAEVSQWSHRGKKLQRYFHMMNGDLSLLRQGDLLSRYKKVHEVTFTCVEPCSILTDKENEASSLVTTKKDGHYYPLMHRTNAGVQRSVVPSFVAKRWYNSSQPQLQLPDPCHTSAVTILVH